MKRVFNFSFILLVLAFSLGFVSSIPEEGMFPLSEIHKLQLKEAGLEIDAKDIYNPDGVSLIDALVRVGGCTGSFVSDNGLIITNHHCAFGIINRASTPEQNYLKNGFHAATLEEEYPAKGTTVRITESYEDVSEIILSAVDGVDDPIERNKIIAETIEKLEVEATDKENSITAIVSEMFIGKTYVLFKYRMIRDVRLVFAPPRAIGEFGGETDNWIWPRHTGDFSFLRAYVAPDGSAAEYNEENVPYIPKNFLQVNANGVEENDFVFILGYPGRTFRHRPSQFLEFQKEIQLPYISNLYEWVINLLEEESKKSTELQLKYASSIKGYANTMKNYKGKMKGLNRINIIENKKTEETAMKNLLAGDEELNKKYDGLFENIDAEYSKMKSYGHAYLWFRVKNRVSDALYILGNLVEYHNSKDLPEEDKPRMLRKENIDGLTAMIERELDGLEKHLEVRKLKKLFSDAIGFESGSEIDAFGRFNGDIGLANAFADSLINSEIFTKEKFFELMKMDKEEFFGLENEFITFAMELSQQAEKIDAEFARINGELTQYLADFVTIKQKFAKSYFVPDANSTLRLTYGNIEGYSPADAIYYSPITTLSGVMDKSTLGGEYEIPEKLKEVYEADVEANKDQPVAILYSTDTTGGNSGSPIMNARGEIIGVNFDRAYEATINDFAWDKSYSRSIGVDIRYVLWVTKNIGGADNLLDEMGVTLN